MDLSKDLISQFVKITNDKKEKSSTESFVYGTAVEYEDDIYVKLDGSETLTPVILAADIKQDERVTVLIKDHMATVIGNMSSPAARNSDLIVVTGIANANASSINAINQDFGVLNAKYANIEKVVADKVDVVLLDAVKADISDLKTNKLDAATALITYATIDNLKAATADIETLKTDKLSASSADLKYATIVNLNAATADILKLKTDKLDAATATLTYATITSLNATNAEINTLKTSKLSATEADLKYATITGLNAANAEIGTLKTDKLSVKDAEVTYANIDFSNIGEAAMSYFYANSGLIQNVTISNGSITGNLVGVTIKGDLIEGGTVKADKLVVKGEDGLFYKLNVDALGETTASSDPKYQNGLDGSVIVAESIVASKIDVDDLVAFDATIGGFNISDSSLYSGVKSSISNSTAGVYLGKDGQVNFGDSNRYLKFYNSNGTYKLDVAADTLTFGGKNVSTEITNASKTASDFLRYSDGTGLVVGKLTGTTLAGNVLIDSDSVDIRSGDKVVASYRGDEIYLGMNSASSIIDLCDGTGTIRNYDTYGDEVRTLAIESNGDVMVNALYGMGMYTGGSVFNADNSESDSNSSLTLRSRYVDSDGVGPIEARVQLSNIYRKTIYNNNSSHSYIDSSSILSMCDNDNDPYIDILHQVSYEDYMGSARIQLYGDCGYAGYSLITIEADDIKLDGIVQINDNRVLLASKGNFQYWGLINPEGLDSGWIRTTSSGIIPYAQDATNGKCSLGTSSWPFGAVNTVNLHTPNIYSFKDADGNYKKININDVVTIDSDGDVIIPNGRAYYCKNASGATRSLIYMNSSNNTVIGYGGYTAGEGQTNIYGRYVKIFSKTANADFKPYYEKGDSVSTVWWMDGFVTSSKTKVYFTIPMAKPIIGSPTVTVTSNSGGLTVRQHGVGDYGYAYGSSDGIKPSSYSAVINTDGNAIKITATMPNTTDVINNAPCAVSADIKITFS